MKTHLPNPRTLLLSIFCLTFFIFSATAQQQTKKISLQGFLKDANGKAVADGSQEITFKLYATATGGNAEWTDTQSINVFGGVYSTHLGSATNPVEGLNWGSSTYYVGVTVQGTELTPRTELTFAPYSLGSPKAQEVVCSGAVGDVKYSILSPSQFTAVNGNCWVPMKGGSIAGSKLATLTGMTNIPDVGGLFIRSQEFSGGANQDPERDSNSAIATFQDQAFASHGHSHSLSASGNTSDAGSHVHDIKINAGLNSVGGFLPGGTPYASASAAIRVGDRGAVDITYFPYMNSGGNHSHNVNVSVSGSISNNGGNETRPKNVNLWTYIRIN